MVLIHQSRMRVINFFLVIWCASNFVISVQAAQLERSNITIAVGGKATLYYLPLTIAEQKGFFSDEGLEVEILDFPGGSKALQALMGGSADVVSGGYDHTIMMQTRRQSLRAFVVQGQTPAISLVISKKREKDWRDTSSLRGWKIGVTSPGSSTNMFVRALLAQSNLSVDDVSIIGVGTGQSAIAAISAGHIDALANVEPAITILLESGRAVEVAETISVEGSKKVYGSALPTASLYTKEEFLVANPNVIAAMTRAMVSALRWLNLASDQQVIDIVPEAYLMKDVALYRAALRRQRPNYSVTGRFSKDGPFAVVESLSRFNELDKQKINVQATFTNQFVDDALK